MVLETPKECFEGILVQGFLGSVGKQSNHSIQRLLQAHTPPGTSGSAEAALAQGQGSSVHTSQTGAAARRHYRCFLRAQTSTSIAMRQWHILGHLNDFQICGYSCDLSLFALAMAEGAE